MIIDRFAGHHSSDVDAAVAHHEKAVHALATHRPVAPHLSAALTDDPTLVGASALQGFAQMLCASQTSMRLARASALATQSALKAAAGGTPGERALAESLTCAADGRLKQAASRLEFHLGQHPRDFLAAKLAHALRFMTGETHHMLATTSSILPHWTVGHDGFGFILGCHAFALEETGMHVEAESVGRQAVAIEPNDVWGLHAVAHVMEMCGRIADGATWLESTRPVWRNRTCFGSHLAWHLALFRLSRGDDVGALALYDSDMLPSPTGDFRDMMNAVSILWRLQQEGADVGDRWRQLHAIALDRRHDATYVLASLHNLLALIASGDFPAAFDLLDSLRAKAAETGCDQAGVSTDIGVPLCEAILSASGPDTGLDNFGRLSAALPALGGSQAQRDVFLRELLKQASKSGDHHVMAEVATVRLQQRSFDRFHARLERQMMRECA